MNKYSKIINIILIFIMSVYLFAATNDLQKSFLNAEAILAGWESSYSVINTMRVSYCQRLIDYQPPANNPNEPYPVKFMYVERIEDQGSRYYMRYSTVSDGFNRPEKLFEYAFDGKVTQTYFGKERHGSIITGLQGIHSENCNHLKRYMIQNRVPVPDLKDEYPNGVPELAFVLRNGIKRGACTIRPNLESVAGQLCHVIELTSYVTYEDKQIKAKKLYWLAHNKGMCLMRY